MRRGGGAEDDPVADGGEVGAGGGVVADFAGGSGSDVFHAEGGGADEVGFVVLLDEAGDEVGGLAVGEEGSEVGGQA
jgi:hypothetical protein